tara:strand:+ start:779 stop:1024 length:246 start_codon:yes stop_codon:yes gene_type:complete
MKIKLEAIREAISFIKANWIGDLPYWEGAPYEFVGATVFGGVTSRDVKEVLLALKSGEHVDVDDLSGEIVNKKLVKVRVLR